jgi:hypothetical protein
MRCSSWRRKFFRTCCAGPRGDKVREARLLYARAKEASGGLSETLAEYEAVSRYYPGEEARCRHAAALATAGQPERAAAIYAAVCRSVERSPGYYRRVQRQWYDLAKGHLER